MNEITMRTDTLLDEISKFHFGIKKAKPSGEQLEHIREIAWRVRKIETLIENQLTKQGVGSATPFINVKTRE